MDTSHSVNDARLMRFFSIKSGDSMSPLITSVAIVNEKLGVSVVLKFTKAFIQYLCSH